MLILPALCLFAGFKRPYDRGQAVLRVRQAVGRLVQRIPGFLPGLVKEAYFLSILILPNIMRPAEV